MSSSTVNNTAILNGSQDGKAAADTTNTTAGADVEAFTLGMLLRPEVLVFEGQVISTALGIIWVGCHASIRRPPSAAPAERRGKKAAKEDKFAEGLVASDAIMFPLMAGTVLIGLYYLIQWLQDPALLNKMLRIYVSFLSIYSLTRLCTDALHVLTTLVFPSYWASRKGETFQIEPETQRQYVLDRSSGERVVAGNMTNPFPGFLSRFSFPDKLNGSLWRVRHLLTKEWTIRLAIHGLGATEREVHPHAFLGLLLSVGLAGTYYLTNSDVLSNLLGLALSYASFQMLSPTSFSIGTMVLAGLFMYDIVMVFYTPYMITVAKTLDVPIKLTFKTRSGSSILGLGDIVLPGILMALALRFDLHRYYENKIKKFPAPVPTKPDPDAAPASRTATSQYLEVKQPYLDPKGQWGNRVWTWPLLSGRDEIPEALVATVFPKPYFYASVIGYALGMLVTLTMLRVFRHGQPALLYLVPGVVGSVWLTGLRRGELRAMWTYTEDGSLDTKDVVVRLDEHGHVVKDPVVMDENHQPEASEGMRSDEMQSNDSAEKTDVDYELFSFTVTAPRQEIPRAG